MTPHGVSIDHVTSVVEDPTEACRHLLDAYGIGSERSSYLTYAGATSWIAPLLPPSYLEMLSIEDEDVAEASAVGRQLLDRRRGGGGVIAWSILVDDLESVSQRVGISIFDYTKQDHDGNLRGWRSVTGPTHLPFFIEYARMDARMVRLQDMYQRVGHRCAPTVFSQLTISCSKSELDEWIGPHDLPLRTVSGSDGLVEALVATADGEVIVR